jgi:NAD(P)-dependent dehydrogenase (short-subunit alcohol dehydrogenase family)
MPLVPPIQPFDPAPLRDRVVLITGGAQGIGRGIAQCVLGAGGRVLIGDLDDEAGEACLDEWNVGDAARYVRLDVSREASAKRFADTALKRFGRIDGLVNNAGIANPHVGDLAKLPLHDWNRYIATNLTGAFLCCKYALPALRKADGAVVNIASSRLVRSEPHTEPYATTKGGLFAFTHALAISEGPHVRVNCVSPGWVVTDAWRKPSARRVPKLSKRDNEQHPVGRVGTPEDIGALVVFLLSKQSGFITGENFIVDGGMTRKMQYA